MVSLPVYTTSISTASELLTEIFNCTGVYRWKKEVSCLNPVGFDVYLDISLPWEDFPLLSAHAYWINVTAPGIWVPTDP